MDFICCTCLRSLTNSEGMQTHPIFELEPSAGGDNNCMRLEQCTGVEYRAFEPWPLRICERCLTALDAAFSFRIMCIQNQRKLMNIVSKIKSDSSTIGATHQSEDTCNLDRGESESLPEIVEPETALLESTESNDISSTSITNNAQISNAKIMCEICGNIYSKQSVLTLHMRRHLQLKPFECELCHKSFATKPQLHRHMRVHTGDKPFTCKFCERSFGDLSTIKKHERVHTKERPYMCKTCGKDFSYSHVLKDHMLTHSGEKRFRCNPCSKTFARRHFLNQHLRTLTHIKVVKNQTKECDKSME